LDEVVVPFGYDAETQLYFPLGLTEDGITICIAELPDPEPTFEKGLVNSLKIYFQKVVSKIVGGFEYPLLRMVQLDQYLNQEYITDKDRIKREIEGAKTIVIFMHGIIGDTADQPKLLGRAKRKFEGNSQRLIELFDLVLSFDYENLNTPIEQTGRDFKMRLEEYGLIEGHGKNVIVVAHSMGGLVSRWFVEKEEGNKLITHLIQVGTPNEGSPWASIYDMATVFFSKAVR
jgi:pimeloyl-ACP methyl ester carboxylesterase